MQETTFFSGSANEAWNAEADKLKGVNVNGGFVAANIPAVESDGEDTPEETPTDKT